MQVLTLNDLTHSADTVGQEILDYYKNFLAKPHPQVGRSGAVCPFVPGSLKNHTLYTVIAKFEWKESDIKQTLLQFKNMMEAVPDGLNLFYAYVLVLPFNQASCVDSMQRCLKQEMVQDCFMVGEFHDAKESHGLHSKSFKPLKSKYPMLVIRKMVYEDIPFLVSDVYSKEEKISYLSAYVRYYPENFQARRMLTFLKVSNFILPISCIFTLLLSWIIIKRLF